MVHIITTRQTTYWNIASCGACVRVHFIGKEEYAYSPGEFESWTITNEHPTRLDYQSDWSTIYLASSAVDPEQLLSEMKEFIDSFVGEWRNWRCYYNDLGGEHILSGGYGMLLAAPTAIVDACCPVLRKAERTFSVIPAHKTRWPRLAFVAGNGFVVARSVRCEIVA